MAKMTNDQLKQLQALPLNIKIRKTEQRIREWYEHWEGNVYVSFSGGKDSTVLLDIVRNLYPNVPAVFSDTGLEYPEIKEFVKTFPNVTIVRPKHSFKEILTKYGYPIISKEVANTVDNARRWIKENLTDDMGGGVQRPRTTISKKYLDSKSMQHPTRGQTESGVSCVV